MATGGTGLVGRDRPLARVQSVVADAAETARPRVVLVTGEAGIGKSHFADALGARLREDGWLVAVGRAAHLEGGSPPYLPFVQVIRTILESVDVAHRASILGGIRDDVAVLLPEIGLRRADGPTVIDDGILRRARLFEGVLDVGERVAESRPLAVIVEDLQWLDPSSADLLRFVVEGARIGRIVLVVTARTGEADPDGTLRRLLADLTRPDGATWIELERLDRTEVGRLIAEQLGTSPPPELVDDIERRSDGVPLLVEELAGAHARGETMSHGLRAALSARLDALGPDTREVVRVAALIEPSIDEHRLAAAAGADTRAIEAAVREALDAAVLVRRSDDAMSPIAFRHPILREVADASLLPGERRRLHRAIAEAALEDPRRAGLAPAWAARHWAGAGVPEPALAAAVQAGAIADEVAAHQDVIDMGRLALDLWPQVEDAGAVAGTDRATVLEWIADAELCLGRPEAAIATLRAAIDELPNGPRALASHGRLRIALFESGDAGGALADALAAVGAPRVPGDELWRAEAMAHLAGLALAARRWGDARRLAADAGAILADIDDPEAVPRRALALGVEGLAAVELGEPEAGLAAVREAWSAAATAGARGHDLAYRQLTALLARLGRFEEVIEVAEEGRVAAARYGLARTLGPTLATDTIEALVQLGRWDEASAMLDRLAIDYRDDADLDRRTRAAARLALRRDGEAPTMAAESPRPGGPEREEIAWAELAAEAAILGGRPAEAIAAVASAAERLTGLEVASRAVARNGGGPAPVEPLAILATWAAAELTAGPSDRDDPTVASTLAALDDLLSAPVGPLADVLAAERRRLARVQERPDRTDPDAERAAWDRATVATAEHGLGWWTAWSSLHGAEAAAAGGDGEAAAAGVAAAWAIAEGLGSKPLRDASERLARQLGVPLPVVATDAPTRPVGHGTHLTAREAAVLALLVEGFSNREIAERLAISHKTASVHVSNILGKLEVDNRTQAAALAVRLGLVGTATDRR